MSATNDATGNAVTLPKRWPSELPLLILTAVAAAVLWLLIAVTIVGAVYAAVIVGFLFLAHVGFVTYLRGSAVRLGPRQLQVRCQARIW